MDTDYFPYLLGNIVFSPVTSETFLFFLLALSFLLFSGYLSASESACFSLSNEDLHTLKESDHLTDQKVIKLLDKSEHLLATFLITESFTNICYLIFGYYFCTFFIQTDYSLIIEILMKALFLFIPLLLFGEMIPKIYSSQHPLDIVRGRSVTTTALNIIFSPFSNVLVRISGFIGKKFPPKNYNVSLDELSQAIEMTNEEEILDEKELLRGIVKFADKTAVEIMTARLNVADIDIKKNFKYVIDFIRETGYSRIPVYADTDDFIKGILYIKDLLPHLGKPDNFRWQSLIRPAFFVPETKKIRDLLEDFQQNKIHLAIVVDEFGGTSGIVTMEDILEEIVGEISDEYDEEEKQFIKLSDNIYIFQAKILLDDFFKITGIDDKDFDALSDEPETLAGLILELRGDFPSVQEIVNYKNYSFTILEISKQRIIKVKLMINNTTDKQEIS
ncbi:MAG: gliding motility-associated protein GldE [Candidatus Azobacteroides sp.]|nr:gliding motility-associated protein GldE [Candidatus Azobacteroides sp.]